MIDCLIGGCQLVISVDWTDSYYCAYHFLLMAIVYRLMAIV